jgi:hypothetical protein
MNETGINVQGSDLQLTQYTQISLSILGNIDFSAQIMPGTLTASPQARSIANSTTYFARDTAAIATADIKSPNSRINRFVIV